MASGGVRTAYDVAKAIALGADGCVIGTAELVALGCMRLGTFANGTKAAPWGSLLRSESPGRSIRRRARASPAYTPRGAPTGRHPAQPWPSERPKPPRQVGPLGISRIKEERKTQWQPVGYFEGTDPIILTRLAAKGNPAPFPSATGSTCMASTSCTLPRRMASRWLWATCTGLPANGHRSRSSRPAVACISHEIPVILVPEKAFHDAARDRLGEMQAGQVGGLRQTPEAILAVIS